MNVTTLRSSKPGCCRLSVNARATKIRPFFVHCRGRRALIRPRGSAKGAAVAPRLTALLTAKILRTRGSEAEPPAQRGVERFGGERPHGVCEPVACCAQACIDQRAQDAALLVVVATQG